MIHRCRCEGRRILRMANITLTGRRNMATRLGQGIGKFEIAVMAGRTLADRTCRVEHLGRLEGNLIGMTIGARPRGRDVGTRLTQRVITVMASRTNGIGRRMHIGHGRP